MNWGELMKGDVLLKNLPWLILKLTIIERAPTSLNPNGPPLLDITLLDLVTGKLTTHILIAGALISPHTTILRGADVVSGGKNV